MALAPSLWGLCYGSPGRFTQVVTADRPPDLRAAVSPPAPAMG